MNGKVFKGYVFSLFSGLLLAAGVLLICLQWGNTGNFSLYGKNMVVSTGLLMAFSAIGGIVLWQLARLLICGLASLRAGHHQQTPEQTPPSPPAKEQDPTTPTT